MEDLFDWVITYHFPAKPLSSSNGNQKSMWFPQLEQGPDRKTWSVNKNHPPDADALNVKRTRRYVLGSKSWWWTTMHTTGIHVATKARKKPPMSNAQSLRKNCNLGKLIIFVCNKCKMLDKWEWIFVWSGCRQVEHQRSLSPSLCKQIKVENKTVSTQRNNVNRISSEQDLNKIMISIFSGAPVVVHCIFGNTRTRCNMRPRPNSN